MQLFIVFGKNMGNLKHGKALRAKQESLIKDWNSKFTLADGDIAFVGYFRHTGNYVLNAADQYTVDHLSRILSERIGTENFTLFRYTDFSALADSLNLALSNTPASIPGRTWTPGLVMNLSPKGGEPSLPHSETRFVFGSFAVPRIRIAWKGDILNADGTTLDKTRREGGWGSLAAYMRDKSGGSWTARAMSTVKGLLQRASAYETRRV